MSVPLDESKGTVQLPTNLVGNPIMSELAPNAPPKPEPPRIIVLREDKHPDQACYRNPDGSLEPVYPDKYQKYDPFWWTLLGIGIAGGIILLLHLLLT